MPFRPQRPQSVAAFWARRLGRFSLLLALLTLILHRIGMLDLPNAVAALLLASGLAIVVLYMSMVGLFMLWHIGAKGGHAAFSGIVMALIVLGPMGFAASRYVLLPKIHDVSTDISAAPQWLEEPEITVSWLPRPDADDLAARQSQIAAYPQITGRRYEGAIDRVLLAVRAVVEERKWTPVADFGVDELVDGLEPVPEADSEVAAETSTGEADPARAPIPLPRPDVEDLPPAPPANFALMQYRSKTLVLGITQDVLIRLDEEEETTYVDMRAATRDGNHDLGLNAELIRKFLRDLDVRLLGIAGG